MERPLISFLTDFGPDAAAAICRGVMLGIARDAVILDISHSVRKYAIRDGAFLLWATLPSIPVAIHVAVVDPGVGTARLPIGVRTGRGDVLIGPNNGLLMPAAERLGGIEEVRSLENRDLMLPSTSSTFHGRDIFSPGAAHLAAGRQFSEVGPPISVQDLVELRFPSAVVRDGGLDTSVLYVDSFGNLRFAGFPDDLAAAIGPLEPGRPIALEFAAPDGRAARRDEATWERTFGETPLGAPLIYEDSFGQIAYADNEGNGAARRGVGEDRPVRIQPA